MFGELLRQIILSATRIPPGQLRAILLQKIPNVGALRVYFGGLGHHFSDFLVAGAAKGSQVLKMWSQGSHSGRKVSPTCLQIGLFGSHLRLKWCQKVAKGLPEEIL